MANQVQAPLNLDDQVIVVKRKRGRPRKRPIVSEPTDPAKQTTIIEHTESLVDPTAPAQDVEARIEARIVGTLEARIEARVNAAVEGRVSAAVEARLRQHVVQQANATSTIATFQANRAFDTKFRQHAGQQANAFAARLNGLATQNVRLRTQMADTEAAQRISIEGKFADLERRFKALEDELLGLKEGVKAREGEVDKQLKGTENAQGLHQIVIDGIADSVVALKVIVHELEDEVWGFGDVDGVVEEEPMVEE